MLFEISVSLLVNSLSNKNDFDFVDDVKEFIVNIFLISQHLGMYTRSVSKYNIFHIFPSLTYTRNQSSLKWGIKIK